MRELYCNVCVDIERKRGAIKELELVLQKFHELKLESVDSDCIKLEGFLEKRLSELTCIKVK